MTPVDSHHIPQQPSLFDRPDNRIWRPDIATEARMDDKQRAVFRVLWPSHAGKPRALARARLESLFGVPDREMRDIVASLVINHGVPIGVSLGTPHGYYIVATRDEAADAYRLQRSYGLASLRRASAIRNLVDAAELRRIQTELPLDDLARN